MNVLFFREIGESKINQNQNKPRNWFSCVKEVLRTTRAGPKIIRNKKKTFEYGERCSYIAEIFVLEK